MSGKGSQHRPVNIGFKVRDYNYDCVYNPVHFIRSDKKTLCGKSAKGLKTTARLELVRCHACKEKWTELIQNL